MFELRSFEKEAFLIYKEEIYENRRARVSKYCQYLLQQNFGQKGRIKNYFSNRFIIVWNSPKEHIRHPPKSQKTAKTAEPESQNIVTICCSKTSTKKVE